MTRRREPRNRSTETMRSHSSFLGAVVASLLSSCSQPQPGAGLGAAAQERAAATDVATPSLKSLEHFIHTPLFRQQTEYTCGVAALQSVLHYYGDEDTDEPTVAAELGTDES